MCACECDVSWYRVRSLLFNVCVVRVCCILVFFFFQAEDGIRDLVRSRGLGDVYKRQAQVGESVKHAWYRYGAGDETLLRPFEGETAPEYTLSLIHI